MVDYGTYAFVAALAGTLLFAAGVAEYLGYLSSSLVLNINSTEFAIFGILAIIVAVACNAKADDEGSGGMAQSYESSRFD
jgi:hypothetical protein